MSVERMNEPEINPNQSVDFKNPGLNAAEKKDIGGQINAILDKKEQSKKEMAKIAEENKKAAIEDQIDTQNYLNEIAQKYPDSEETKNTSLQPEEKPTEEVKKSFWQKFKEKFITNKKRIVAGATAVVALGGVGAAGGCDVLDNVTVTHAEQPSTVTGEATTNPTEAMQTEDGTIITTKPDKTDNTGATISQEPVATEKPVENTPIVETPAPTVETPAPTESPTPIVDVETQNDLEIKQGIKLSLEGQTPYSDAEVQKNIIFKDVSGSDGKMETNLGVNYIVEQSVYIQGILLGYKEMEDRVLVFSCFQDKNLKRFVTVMQIPTYIYEGCELFKFSFNYTGGSITSGGGTESEDGSKSNVVKYLEKSKGQTILFMMDVGDSLAEYLDTTSGVEHDYIQDIHEKSDLSKKIVDSVCTDGFDIDVGDTGDVELIIIDSDTDLDTIDLDNINLKNVPFVNYGIFFLK